MGRLAQAALVAGLLAAWMPPIPMAHAGSTAAAPGETGNGPAIGRSLFDEVFDLPPADDSGNTSGASLPVPFERLLAAIGERLTPDAPMTALIPVGRSLQRFAAEPDYFGSPRIIAAATGDGVRRPGDPLLRDRLYLGYQRAAGIVEVISYNEAAGRFEFQEVTGYDTGEETQVRHAERSVCLACHQGAAPIFPSAFWSETNAGKATQARLRDRVGEAFAGVPVATGLGTVETIDRSVLAANRIAVVNLLWQQGCGDGDAGKACRAGLLSGALRFRLGGSLAQWFTANADPGIAARFDRRVTSQWPSGLAIVDPNIPDRDPAARLVSADVPRSAVEPEGVFDPTSQRQAIPAWQPEPAAQATFTSAARLVATAFAEADIAAIADLIAGRRPEAQVAVSATCRIGSRPDGRTGFACKSPALTATGSLAPDRASGRITALQLDGHGWGHRIAVRIEGTAPAGAAGSFALEAENPRLSQGGLIADLRLSVEPGGGGTLAATLNDDAATLGSAIAGLAAADRTGVLDGGPLRRRAVLAAVLRALAVSGGAAGQ